MTTTTTIARPDHRTYFGGGDAAAILGLHPWRTPEDVISEKLGLREPKSASYRMRRGQHVEPLLAQWYGETHADRPDRLSYPGEFVRHPQHEFLGGHPDALVQLPDGSYRLVELKLTARRGDYGLAETDAVPNDTYCQVQHYAAILRELVPLDAEAHVVADLGDDEPVLYRLPLDPYSLDFLRDREIEAWETWVEGKILPPPHNPAEARARWPHEKRPVAHATTANVEDHELLLRHMKASKKLETEIDMLKLKLMRSMAECGALMDGTATLATWRDAMSSHLDVKRLKEEQPAIYAQYLASKPTRRFSVKERR